MPKPQSAPAKVFLNIPYDKKFEKLFLAFIAGTSAFGLVPRATLEIRKSSNRLDKIFDLIKACQYSIHDLSRVELDRDKPQTPRFNMPFELGLSVAWSRISQNRRHRWFVCESDGYRLQKSLSDLNGIDPKVHSGRINDVFVELRNIFARSGHQPSVQEMKAIYLDVRKKLPGILSRAGRPSLYTPSVFRDIRLAASASAAKNVH